MVSFRIFRTDILIGSALIFVSVFLMHEIAHKLVAQHFGLWAEFRLTMFGALLTLISVISPFKIISPGAVMIAGYANKETIGKTAMAGPATNLTLSIVLFALFRYLQPNSTIALLGALFNAWIALFNLFPLGILDGWKVFNWDKIIWATVFVASVALTILTYSTYLGAPILLTSIQKPSRSKVSHSSFKK
jgi:Zn-dependent protease